MSRLALLAALLAAAPAVSAQAAFSAPAQEDLEPRAGQRAAVVTSAVVVGVGAAAGTFLLVGDDGAGAALAGAAYIGGTALGVAYAADALGLAVDTDDLLVDALLAVPAGVLAGGVVGLGVAGVGYLVSPPADYNFVPALIGAGVGGLTALTVTGVVASRSVEAAPAAFRAPTGEAGAGLGLRIGL